MASATIRLLTQEAADEADAAANFPSVRSDLLTKLN